MKAIFLHITLITIFSVVCQPKIREVDTDEYKKAYHRLQVKIASQKQKLAEFKLQLAQKAQKNTLNRQNVKINKLRKGPREAEDSPSFQIANSSEQSGQDNRNTRVNDEYKEQNYSYNDNENGDESNYSDTYYNSEEDTHNGDEYYQKNWKDNYSKNGSVPEDYQMASKWIPIKIWADISRLNDMRDLENGEFIYNIVTTKLIPDVLNYLKFIYKVKEVPYLRLNQNRCFEVRDISNINDKDIFFHLALVFTFSSDKKDNTLAWAGVCAFSPLTGRPIAGQVNLNYKYISKMSDEKYIEHFETVIHEVHHILGINPTIFPFFIYPGSENLVRPLRESRKKMYNKSTGKSYTKMLLPNLVKLAQRYFKCDDIDGVPLEDSGESDSKGTHFEKKWFGNEIMISDENLNMKISSFTFKFLEDTGWYKPQYKRRERFPYLYGEGCTILNSGCKDLSRVCDMAIQGPICSYDYTGIGECSKGDIYSDNCPLFITMNIDCRNPDHATKQNSIFMDFDYGNRCFEGILDPDLIYGKKSQPQRQAFCAKSKCYTNKEGLTAIKIELREKSVICNRSYAKIPIDSKNLKKYIRCPNIEDFCWQMKKSCPYDCNLKGRCLANGRCSCYRGYTGKYCDEIDHKLYIYDYELPNSPEQCIPKCLNSGTCRRGKCQCVGDYFGKDCSQFKISMSKQSSENSGAENGLLTPHLLGIMALIIYHSTK